ncbi:hypothetical protein [Arthrobacter oryzae]|uniref:Uncharacterized protein n=1 Tax=Arthrobacter oryzae TaxID=409290 RepID=A0A3N0C282_9MICC|nr:hypothetical protein [Arthrobacter oryzae]RNL56362.1 hypothetical protein D7003_08600 [Arthrobacter oryzae]
MDAGEAQRVTVSSELSVGEEIEAWHRGRLFHRGTVSRTAPSTDLFWITEATTGMRRLIDLEALVILRVPAGGGPHAGAAGAKAGTAKAATAGATGRPASRAPLFQEPGFAAH